MINVKQIYETELMHESGLGFCAITIPRRSIENVEFLDKPEYIAEIFGIQIVDSFDLGWVQRAILTILASDSIDELSEWRESNTGLAERISGKSEYYEFAEYISMTPVIPFENSPLSADSLGNLITKTGGVGIGAYIGFLVGGTTPLLFITVPAGIIICGVAAGIGQGLEEGLRARISKFIKGE